MKKENTGIVYGVHAVRHVLEHSPETVLDFWVVSSAETDAVRQLTAMARTCALAVQEVPRKTLDKLAGAGARHQGIAIRQRRSAISRQTDLQELLENKDVKNALFLILDGIQDPHNLGACLRTADASGVDAVIIPRDHSVGITATVSKVACGAAETVTIITVVNLARAMRQLQEAGIWLVGTDGEAGESLYQVDLTVPIAFVMGAEGTGLRHNTRKYCDRLVKIPMYGSIESLNLSVATGICLYEAMRQRNT